NAAALGVPVHTWIGFFVFWFLQLLIIIKGVEGIKWLETISAPLLLLGGAALLWWAAAKAGGMGKVLDASAALQKQHGNFWHLFAPFLTASVGYWAPLSNDISNLNPRLISYVTGGLITAVIGVLMMPWKLMGSMGAYIFTWLIGYSGLMGAIAGVMIADYWILRRQKLDLAELFNPNG